MTKKRIIGKRTFGDTVDITDPCYDKDTWCRLNGVKIKPGEYTCYIRIEECEEEWEGKTQTYEQVNCIGIELPKEKGKGKWISIGSVGVDAGQAGFFENKPDFNDDEWDELGNLTCGKNQTKLAYFIDSGFFSWTAFGDGYYKVLAKKNSDGLIVSLKIVYT